MGTDAALAWLEERLDGVPPELADALRELLRRRPRRLERDGSPGETGAAGEGEGVAWTLASASLAGFDRVTAGRGHREVAAELLAADAALTFAFEAAVEEGLDVLALADRLGVRGELGHRLERAAVATPRPDGTASRAHEAAAPEEGGG